MQNYKTVSIVLGAILLVGATAGASVYLTKQPASVERAASTQSTQHSAQRVVERCNDDNIAGKAAGGVGGGVIGSLAGKGNGKTAATIAGTLGGAYLGGEVIPLQNVTCR